MRLDSRSDLSTGANISATGVFLRLAQERRRRAANQDLSEDAARAKANLSEYVKQAWHVVEPSTPLLWGWHIDHICDHLQAVTEGKITRLLINVPPGFSKSLLTSVFWPSWVWLNRPSWRMLCASYGMDLALRDSTKCRMLVEGDWYQQTFSPEWAMSKDQRAKGYYNNSATGFRAAISVGGKTTGYRADCVVIDDPLNVTDAYSDVKRLNANNWFDYAASNRLANMKTGAIILIMQRLHHEDVAGHILEQGGWEHLNLPMEYEAKHAYRTSIGFDPRQKEGELLFPALFPPEVVDREKRKGELYFAGQYQQRPTPAAGNLFRQEMFLQQDEKGNWQFWDFPDLGKNPPLEAYLSFDTAFAIKKSNDYTAGVLNALCADGYVYCMPLVLDRLTAPHVQKLMAILWAKWRNVLGPALKSAKLEVNSAGANIAQELPILMAQKREQEKKPSPIWTQDEWDAVRAAPRIIVHSYTTKVKADVKAYQVLPFCEARMVRMVKTDVARQCLEMMLAFPLASHDDFVSAFTEGVMPFIETASANTVVTADALQKVLRQDAT